MYTLLPLIYGILVLPVYYPVVFALPRLYLLEYFIGLCLFLKFLSFIIKIDAQNEPKEISRSLINNLRSSPAYIKILPLIMISLFISTIFSPHRAMAWQGALSNFAGFKFFFFGIAVVWLYATAKNVDNWGFRASFFLVSLLTIIEYLGFRPLDFTSSAASAYPAATIGFRGHLAGFLILAVGFSLFWLLKDSQRNRVGNGLVLFVSAVALSCTTNSSAFIGLALMCICSAAMLFFSKQNGKLIYIILLPILVYGSHTPLAAFGEYLYNAGLTNSKPSEKDLTKTVTLETRKLLWKSGINMFLKRPIFGWGAQNFEEQWYNYLTPAEADRLAMLETGIKTQNFISRDKDLLKYKDEKSGQPTSAMLKYRSSHSAYIDFLFSYGLIGVISVITCLVLGVKHLYKLNGKTAYIFLIPFSGYAIYSLAWFVTVPVWGMACMLTGYVLHNPKSSERILNNE